MYDGHIYVYCISYKYKYIVNDMTKYELKITHFLPIDR